MISKEKKCTKYLIVRRPSKHFRPTSGNVHCNFPLLVIKILPHAIQEIASKYLGKYAFSEAQDYNTLNFHYYLCGFKGTDHCIIGRRKYLIPWILMNGCQCDCVNFSEWNLICSSIPSFKKHFNTSLVTGFETVTFTNFHQNYENVVL